MVYRCRKRERERERLIIIIVSDVKRKLYTVFDYWGTNINLRRLVIWIAVNVIIGIGNGVSGVIVAPNPGAETLDFRVHRLVHREPMYVPGLVS